MRSPPGPGNARTKHRIAERGRAAQGKAEEDAWRLGLENQLRAAKGEPLLASIEDLDAVLDEEEAAIEDGAPSKPDEDDAILSESGRILSTSSA